MKGEIFMSSAANRKEARMNMQVDASAVMSERAYNFAIGLVVLYGILVNILIVAFASDYALRLVGTINPIILLIVYLALVFGGSFISMKSQNPVISFLGYNMIVLPLGIILSIAVTGYGGIGSEVVIDAFKYTLGITLVIIGMSCLLPKLFLRMGGFLFAGLLGMIIVEVVAYLFFGGTNWTSYAIAALFSLYIGYDVQKAQLYPRTLDNAIDSAIDIYLDITNLFIRILSILGNRSD